MVREHVDHSLQFWAHPPRWAYLVIAPWAIGAIFLITQWRHFDHVAGRQRTTEGTVVAHEPQNHNRYGYTFSVDGRVYRGWDSRLNRPLTLGESVHVYYDPTDPETSALEDFAELSLDALGPVPLIVFVSLGVLGAIFIVRRRAKLGQPLW